MKISKCMILYILIIISMFFGSMHPYLTYLCFTLSGFFALAIGLSYKDNNVDVGFGVVLLLCFQNLCIGLGAHIASNTDGSLKLITQIPFMTIGIIWFLSLLDKNKGNSFKITNNNFWIVLYFLCIFLSLFIGRGSINSVLVNARNMIVFYMAYIIGKNYFNNIEQMDSFYSKYIKLMYFVFIVGVILLIFGYGLYGKIGMNEVYIAKGGTGVNNAIDSRFYTKLFSWQVVRMGSIYYEPVNLAYFFAFGFILILYYNKKSINYKFLDLLVCGIGLFLTFGKGGYMIVGLVIIYEIFDKYIKIFLRRISSKRKNFIVILLMISIVAFFVEFYIKKYPNNPVMPHIRQIQSTYNSIIKRPFGHGLGTGGNMGKLFNRIESYSAGNGQESGLMTFLYQIGIQGVLCLFMVFKGLFNFKVDDNSRVFKMNFILPFILLIVSLFQENTFTPQCIVIFMIYLGAMNSIYSNELSNVYS